MEPREVGGRPRPEAGELRLVEVAGDAEAVVALLGREPGEEEGRDESGPSERSGPERELPEHGAARPPSAHGNGVDRREDDVAGGPEPAAARRDRARRRGDTP